MSDWVCATASSKARIFHRFLKFYPFDDFTSQEQFEANRKHLNELYLRFTTYETTAATLRKEISLQLHRLSAVEAEERKAKQEWRDTQLKFDALMAKVGARKSPPSGQQTARMRCGGGAAKQAALAHELAGEEGDNGSTDV